MKKTFLSLITLVFVLVLIACGTTNGNESEIKVYTRDTTSGTRGAFFEIIGLPELGSTNDGLVEGYVSVESNGQMMSSVNNDINGIGYISLSGLEGSGLKGLSFNGIEASEENVLSDEYALKRPFMFIRKNEDDITNDEEKALVAAFLAYMETKDGKEVIINNDGIAEGLDTAPTWDSIKADHPVVNETGAQVEIHFGGSTSVQKVAEALSEAFMTIAPTFKPVHNHTGSGAAFTGTRADGTLHIGFASRELKDTEKVEGEYGMLAWDAVVIVVNKDNLLTNITTDEIQKIYTGAVINWKDIIIS